MESLKKNKAAGSAAIILFFSFFAFAAKGIGNFWDWSFPYFQQHGQNLFFSQLTAWKETALGQPLGYASNALGAIMQGVAHLLLRPEWAQAVTVGLLLTISFLAVYFYCLKASSKGVAILAALAAVINSAIFYKLLAGHVNYLFGYCFYLLMILSLSRVKERMNIKEAVLCGLLLALSGIQIQFFIFSGLTLLVFFLVERNKYPLKYLVPILAITVLVHAYWLIGFIIGANSIAGLSDVAKTDSFTSLMHASWKGIASLSFSSATFIRDFYPKVILALFGLFYLVLATFTFIKFRKKENFSTRAKVSWVMLALSVILATGIFHNFPIPVISVLYPMLREVGHAAPLVVLWLILVVVELLPDSPRFKNLLTIYLAAFVLANAVIFYLYVPRFNLGETRQYFQPFQTFLQADQSSDRVLTYPFFNQYSIEGQKTIYSGSQPKSNSGWDSFTIFSGKDHIDNSVSPSSFHDSVQYQFLQSYDVEILKKYGIRYIYDYSAFLSSNYDKFVGEDVYDNNHNLIKNDPLFLQKVIDHNSGKVKLVQPRILEIVDTNPRVGGSNIIFSRVSPTRYEVTLHDTSKVQSLSLLNSYSKGWKIYPAKLKTTRCLETVTYLNQITECIKERKLAMGDELNLLSKKALFDSSHQKLEQYANSWTIDPNQLAKNADGSISLYIYYQPQSWFVVGFLLSILTIIGSLTVITLAKPKKIKLV